MEKKLSSHKFICILNSWFYMSLVYWLADVEYLRTEENFEVIESTGVYKEYNGMQA